MYGVQHVLGLQHQQQQQPCNSGSGNAHLVVPHPVLSPGPGLSTPLSFSAPVLPQVLPAPAGLAHLMPVVPSPGGLVPCELAHTSHALPALHAAPAAAAPAWLLGGGMLGLAQPQPQLQLQPQPCATVFFAGATPTASEDSLLGLFAQFGTVVRPINVFRPYNGCKTSKGCGLVVFSTRQEAAAAMEALHGKFVWPGARSAMVIEWCDPDKQHKKRRAQPLTHSLLRPHGTARHVAPSSAALQHAVLQGGMDSQGPGAATTAWHANMLA